MDNPVLVGLTLCTALASGLVGGVFFAFSNFVMKALARLPPPQGIVAMQSINVVVITPSFMTALFGTGLASIVLSIAVAPSFGSAGSVLVMVGSVLYVVGTDFVTIGLNVPLNNVLAAVAPESAEGARVWREYIQRWTAWNHVRTAASLAASAAFVVALCLARGPTG